MTEPLAEVFYDKFVRHAITVARGYLVVIGQVLVNLTDILLGRIGVVDALLKLDAVLAIEE